LARNPKRFAVESLKVSDLSIWMGKEVLHEPAAPDFLVIAENNSTLDRFNEEKNWVELLLSRIIPMAKIRQMTQLIGMIASVHSDWAYRHLEASVDGVVDFKLESGAEVHDLMRIRSMRRMAVDRSWHRLQLTDEMEVAVEK
jgi:KaiC/GvpD/RAD55 family RecA-like ATPase